MKQTKTDKVLEHLQKCGSLTTWQAINFYKLTRLSAVIFNLKKRGYLIDTEMLDGDGCRYASYRLIGAINEN